VKGRRRPAKAKKSRRSKRARSKQGQTTHTTLKSVKVVRKNPQTRYTIALSPSAARTLALTTGHREILKALRRHPRGGLFVTLPAWHGPHREAQQLAVRVQAVLAYAAGRHRKPLAASPPRVVAVP
jgi:hypothetical protein